MASVLLDSGPLVLYMCGSMRPDLIGKGKTSHHTLLMFEKLLSELSKVKRHISLPNVLTEASNHLGSGNQQAVPDAAKALSLYILNLEEIYQPSIDVIKISEYMNVGLADTAIISCVPQLREKNVKVFTQDWELYNRLMGYEVDCVNIMHWRTPKR